MSRLILASASPRRRELLAQAGFVFEVCPAHIPEEPRPGEDPVAYVKRLAREKAEAVYEKQGQEKQGPGTRDQGPEKQGTRERANERVEQQGSGTRDQGPEKQGTREQGNEGPEDTDLVVLGADTTVTLDGLI